jgi:Tfp pilus assembly pilus retraction ATPase PilT
MIIQELLKYVLDSGSSDLHLMVGSPPAVRNQGRLSFIPNTGVIAEEEVTRMVLSTLNELQ